MHSATNWLRLRLCVRKRAKELDSYMYQTVGQDAIELVARALDVPLYRRVIVGEPLQQGAEYGGRDPERSGGTDGDETEDMLHLLATVQASHPDVVGVSVGAILSNYQRVRVEHVCRRLGLTALAYLWQRDQAELLQEMVSAGLEAVLIKVAGIGLKPAHLGMSLAQMQPSLFRLNELYGAHICGEGGEYETLTLDAPIFKQKIRLLETETVIHSDSDFATVAYLRIKDAVLEPKLSTQTEPPLIIPPLLEDAYASIEEIAGCEVYPENATDSSSTNDATAPSITSYQVPSRSKRLGSWVCVSNVQHDLSSDASLEEEVHRCFSILSTHLAEHGLTLTHLTSVTVLLASMSLFPAVNTAYAEHFGTSPPARACVAVDLPTGVRVRLYALALADTTQRSALHVQGLSYWAPANIGPYSQAIQAANRLFVSGQIGLIPSTLSLPAPRSLAKETALTFQHTARVIRAVSAGAHTQSAVYWLSDVRHLQAVKAACAEYHPESNQPTLFVVVKELPRSSLVEKQVLAHNGRVLVKDDEDDELDEPAWQSREPVYEQGSLSQDNATIKWETSGIPCSTDSAACIFLRAGKDYDLSGLLSRAAASSHILTRTITGALSVNLFHSARCANSLNHKPLSDAPTTAVPCRAISSRDADGWDYAIYIVGSG